MSTPRQIFRITVVARLFTVLLIAGPAVWSRDTSAVLSLMAVMGVWFNASLLERRDHLRTVVPVVEGALIGAICGFALESTGTILLALALPPFVAAILSGSRAVVATLVAELTLVFVAALLWQRHLTADQGLSIFTSVTLGLGLGMVGVFVHSAIEVERDELTPYLDAQRLIRQLLDLSDDLRSGLDVNSLAGGIISMVRDQLPTSGLAIYLPRGEVLVPLVSRTTTSPSDLAAGEELAIDSWARSSPIVFQGAFAFPLGESAVVGGAMAPESGLAESEVESRILDLARDLRSAAVQLDTALLFADFRDSASADVRKRLAREMHDGVAQDIASLGYLVDALAARPASEKQAEQFAMLRDRITKVVAEVRQSVLTLRTSIGEAESLGVAIGAVARHLSESSRIPISVTLDEHSTRLRPEVESELFRIAQEAMNNAIKHAQCNSIEVNCQVYAPEALITVSDDGRGLQQARNDSHGLKIMRERARLIDADLAISDNPGGGLQVSVRIGSST